MLKTITKQTVSSLLVQSLGKNQTNLVNKILWIRSASTIPPGIVGKNKRVLPAHMYKPRPRWETGSIQIFSFLLKVFPYKYVSR